jgi:ABC-2 type transport system permease protein
MPMFFSYRSKAILKREVKQQIFTKKFVIMTISMPLIMLVVLGLQFVIATFDREELSTIHILNESAAFQELVRNQLSSEDFDSRDLYRFEYAVVAADGVAAYVDAQRPALLEGKLTGVLFIPDSARDDKKATYYASNPANQNLLQRMREQLNRALVNEYFGQLNIDAAAVSYARTNVSIDGVRISREGNSTQNPGNLIVAFGFTMLIYISLLSMGPSVMAAVNEEKTNRIVEVLMSAVSAQELLYGKIMGTAVAGLVQMAIWISPVAIISLMSLPALAMMDFGLQLSLFQVLYFLLNYVMGLMVFLSIFAALGAMFDTPQDAQGSMMPVMMLIIIPFTLAFSMVRNPANVLAEVSSMLPFATILVMPARMTLIDVPLWQLGVATLVNFATFYFCIRGGAKIYRITILLTGKRPNWSEIWKWLRYA